MFGNNKKNMNEMLFSMFHLRSKSHLSNSKATQLALRSNWMCKTGFGNFLTAEELAKQEKYRIERDEAVEKLALYEKHHKDLEYELGKFLVKEGKVEGEVEDAGESESDAELYIKIKQSDIKHIESKSVKSLIRRVMEIKSMGISAAEELIQLHQ